MILTSFYECNSILAIETMAIGGVLLCTRNCNLSHAGKYGAVKISDNGLTHKQVSKARRGRKITRRMQLKVLSAWNSLIDHECVIDDLFNYVGK